MAGRRAELAASVVATAHSQIAAQSCDRFIPQSWVSFPAGGLDDCSRARLPPACRQLGHSGGRDRSGAGGNVGAAYVAKPRPTAIRSCSRPRALSQPVHVSHVPFDADRDFVPTS